MKKVFICFFVVISFSVFSQKKEDVYLIYQGGIEQTVQYSAYRDGRNKTPRQYTPNFGMGCFIFYKEYFQVVPNSKVEWVKREDVKKYKVITLDDFLRIRETNEKTQLDNPNNLFKNIFILTSVAHGDNYLKFEVDWIEVFID